MFKVLCLLKKKIGLSNAEFVDHYENHHLPLALKLFPQILQHQRNYLVETALTQDTTAQALPFDVVSHLWFANRAAFEDVLACAQRPEIAQVIGDDEARFMDRSQTRLIVVDERGPAQYPLATQENAA
jgi:uncharacterized protein (TIGR02118 family)